MSAPRVDTHNGVRLTPQYDNNEDKAFHPQGVALEGRDGTYVDAIENNDAKPDGDNPAMPGVLAFANSPDLRHRG
jgi:hypothetical protein